MRRIIGTEVEYGISVPGDATANPVLTSTQVVLAYAAAFLDRYVRGASGEDSVLTAKRPGVTTLRSSSDRVAATPASAARAMVPSANP